MPHLRYSLILHNLMFECLTLTRTHTDEGQQFLKLFFKKTKLLNDLFVPVHSQENDVVHQNKLKFILGKCLEKMKFSNLREK